MNVRVIWIVGCLVACMSVAGGAFGAHALQDLVPPQRIDTWNTGARYAMYHSLATLGVVSVGGVTLTPNQSRACLSWLLGTLLFTGSLWALVLADLPILGAVTPFGGALFMLGWVFAARFGWIAFGPPT